MILNSNQDEGAERLLFRKVMELYFMNYSNDCIETEEQKSLLNKLLLNFILDNGCYCVPMNIREGAPKKPLSRYAWKQQTMEEYLREQKQVELISDKHKRQQEQRTLVRTYRARKHTQSLNHYLKQYKKADSKHDLTVFRYLRVFDYALTIPSYAIVTGKSKLLVIDCDTSNHNEGEEQASCIGLDNLKKWCLDCGIDFNIFLNALTIRTTSGGYHFIFKYEGIEIKKEVGFVASVDLITGQNIFNAPYCAKFTKQGTVKRYLPVRLSEKEGKFVFEYLHFDENLNIGILPKELEIALLKHQEPKIKSFIYDNYKPVVYAISERQKKGARRILEKHLNELAQSAEGGRHEAILKHARAIFMFYQYLSDDYSVDTISSMIENIALNLGLSSGEIKAPLRDAIKFGLSHSKEL